jgi:RNA polymerase sigma-70 factor (ECF subfamily)
MLSERELIKECINGNRERQKQLYEQYSPLFFTLCLRYMTDQMKAEDVLIEGFTTIFAKLDTFGFKGSFEGWMRKIMVNTALATLRADHHREWLEIIDGAYEQIGQQENIHAAMNAKDILKMVSQLSPGYRTVFNLYAIEGYSYKEIAELMGIDIGTVRSQLARARKILQTQLKDYR